MVRFGAALTARRTAAGAGPAAMARRSGGRWAADLLMEVERGGLPLDDDDVLDLAALYGIGAAPLPDTRTADLVLDRTTASDVDQLPRHGGPVGTQVRWRLEALGELLALDVEAFGSSDALVEMGIPGGHPDRSTPGGRGGGSASVAWWCESLSRRVAVPLVGLLVVESDLGSLVVTSRRRARSGRGLAVAGPLVELIAQSRARVARKP